MIRRWVILAAGAGLAVALTTLGLGALADIQALTPTEVLAGRGACFAGVLLVVAYWPRPARPARIPDMREQARRVKAP